MGWNKSDSVALWALPIFVSAGNLHYPKYTKNVREGLGVVDIEVCRESCNSNRERAVFEFLLASGCRIGETKDLLYSDVITGEFQVIGKGSKIRYCYLKNKSDYVEL